MSALLDAYEANARAAAERGDMKVDNVAPSTLLALLGVVRDFAKIDPVVHHLEDYGEVDVYTCGVCNESLTGNAAFEYSRKQEATFPHHPSCPWRRAKELNP